MSYFSDVLLNKMHGVPGLGVNGEKGTKGKKGESIYIGHLISFFDAEYLTDKEFGYLRYKNEKNGAANTDSSFYYRSDGNFYRDIVGIDSTYAQMMTFTIHNLKGVYYDKVPTNSYGKLTLKSILYSTETYPGENWGTDRDTSTELAYDYNENEGLSYKINDIAFNVKLDENYINLRDLNNSEYNYSSKLSSDIVIPTTLKSMYNVGDILYIQDDETENIICYVVITEDLLQCTFDTFVSQEFISVESLSSTFNLKDERVRLNKNLFLPEMNISSSLKEKDENGIFERNFIKRLDNSYPLNIVYNYVDENKKFFEFNNDENYLNFNYDYNYEDFIFGSNKKLKFSNLYLRNVDTNINIKEYNNDVIEFVDDVHVCSVDKDDLTFSESYIECVLNSNKFFKYTSEDLYYGMLFLKKENDKFLIVQKIENVSTSPYLKISFGTNVCDNGTNVFGFCNFVRGIGITTYYSQISEFVLECEKEEDSFKILESKCSFSKNDVLNSTTDTFDNNYFIFDVNTLSCNKGTVSFTISSSDSSIIIKNVYLNNIPLILKGEIDNSFILDSWISGNTSNVKFENNILECTDLSLEANLPYFNYEYDDIIDYPETIKECFDNINIISHCSSTYQIGTTIPETLKREMIVTVIGDSSTQSNLRTSFVIEQPGFTNPLAADISVNFENELLNEKIELSNQSEKGILCNQIQYFTDVTFNNFDKTVWSKYLVEPKIKFKVDLCRDILKTQDGYNYYSDSDLNNVHIYGSNDKNLFENNGIKVSFSWIRPELISIDSSISEIFKNENELTYSTYYIQNEDEIEYINDNNWLPISVNNSNKYSDEDSVPALDRNSSEIPCDVIYKIDNSDENNWIGEFTLEETNSDDKIKLRTFIEIANPIPMEFNFRWRLRAVEVFGELREEYGEEAGTEISFYKKIEDDDTNQSLSDNVKFIINPIYSVLIPESSGQKEVKGTIKKVGPEDVINIRIGLADIDEDAKSEFEYNGWNSLSERFKAMKAQSDGSERINVADITNYYPKRKYLQDNVTSLKISTRDFKTQIVDELLTEKSSPFIKMNSYMLENETDMKYKYNIFPLDYTNKINSSFEYNYISLFFDADYMNPMTRDEKLTFYYNSELYDYDLFNQWNKKNPIWINYNFQTEIIDEDMAEAKKIWNSEYDVSKIYNKDDVIGGVLSKSGNGYLYLDNSVDENQYEEDGILSLETVKSDSTKKILETSYDIPFEINEKYEIENDNLFRGLVFKIDWKYPYFFENDSSIKVSTYSIVNSYESYKDSEIIENFFENNESEETLDEFLLEYSQDKTLFNYSGSFEKFYSKKVEQPTLDDDKTVNDDLIKINMMIPYNLLYDVFPRVMYNIDSGRNSFNVFMLQQPSITTNGNFTFSDRYYDINSDDEYEYGVNLDFS